LCSPCLCLCYYSLLSFHFHLKPHFILLPFLLLFFSCVSSFSSSLLQVGKIYLK
jgi:hypothetical protein